MLFLIFTAVLLDCTIQNYAWGKIGSESKVAQLAQNSKDGFVVEEEKPYAELWMGTHPNGPSQVQGQGSLLELISARPSCLGETIQSSFGDMLPFLFKVLSVNKSLSIQAHPNKELAAVLHTKFPDKYKDSNHKPEMAIALTDFEGMCGFRPIEELQDFVKSVPELCAVIGQKSCDLLLSVPTDDNNAVSSALKTSFSSLMRCESAIVADNVSQLVQRLDVGACHGIDDSVKELVLRLNSQFCGDVGCFSAFFLNHMRLKPGQAMFLAANLPHAYLAGDCIECMAQSDNVVRAGLTPKFKDVDTLCDMLDYSPRTAEQNLMSSHKREDNPNVTLYNPPVPDFAVMKVEIPKATVGVISKESSASILLVVQGQGQLKGVGQLLAGQVIFLPANEMLEFTDISANMTIYRALCVPM